MLGKGGKKKGVPFPDIEGQESAADFVAKYKRACLGRKAAHRDLQEKIAAENPVAGKTLYFCLAKICAKFCKSCTFRLLLNVKVVLGETFSAVLSKATQGRLCQAGRDMWQIGTSILEKIGSEHL